MKPADLLIRSFYGGTVEAQHLAWWTILLSYWARKRAVNQENNTYKKYVANIL